MFQRHPELCEQIFAPYWNSERDNFSISSDCGSFLALPQVKTLVAISKDFSANPQDALAQPKFAQISHLYVLAQAPAREEMDKLEGWNTQLWTNLSKSVAGNTILQKNYQLLQIAYQDALRTVEDFYLKKGFVYTDARALG
jgi:glutaredoxin-related protein